MSIWDDDREVVDAPEWCKGITWAQVAGVAHGGCESGCYMPAVIYHKARATMSEHGDEVIEYLAHNHESALEIDLDETSWSGLACRLLSSAVNTWCASKAEEWVGD